MGARSSAMFFTSQSHLEIGSARSSRLQQPLDHRLLKADRAVREKDVLHAPLARETSGSSAGVSEDLIDLAGREQRRRFHVGSSIARADDARSEMHL